MKMTITTFDEQIAKDKQTRESLQAELDELLRQEAALEADANAAADAGDVDEYLMKKAAKDRVTAALFVKRKQFDKLSSSVTEADARTAWANYVAEYNSKLAEGLKAFEEVKADLLQRYSYLVSLQADALAVRSHLGNAVGIDKTSLPMDYIPVMSGLEAKGALRLAGFNCVDPDAAYFMANHCRKNNKTFVGISNRDPEEERVYSVVVTRNA